MLLDYYRAELNRIAWRIQHHIKKNQYYEISDQMESFSPNYSFMNTTDERIIIRDLLDRLSSEIGRTIIYKIYIQDRTENEVAKDLNVTQQAVNKWKKKMLLELSLMMSYKN